MAMVGASAITEAGWLTPPVAHIRARPTFTPAYSSTTSDGPSVRTSSRFSVTRSSSSSEPPGRMPVPLVLTS